MSVEQEQAGEGDKLRDGPCAKPYLELEACAADKNVKSHKVRILDMVPTMLYYDLAINIWVLRTILHFYFVS